MTSRKNGRHDLHLMRTRAEDINRENSVQTPEIMEARSPEMQNEELRRLQSELDELRRNVRMQDVLREIAEAMVRAQPLEEFYQTIHRLTERVLPAAQFRVNLLDEEAGEIISAYCTDDEDGILKRRPIDRGLTEYVMRLGHAVHITPALLCQLIETGEYTLWKTQNKNARQSLCAPLIDSTGKPFGMISLISMSAESFFKAIDVETLSIIAAQISMAIEYKRIKAELVAERNLFKTVIDKIPDRIFVKDRQSRFILNNIAHIKALGAFSQSEVLGKTRHDFKSSGFAAHQLADCHLADDRIVMENDKLLTREEPTILPSGETGTLLISKIPLHNENGEVIGLIGFNRDISESKRAEQALRESEALYFALIQDSTAGIILRDESGLITYANETFVRMMQADSPKELVGVPYLECVHPEDQAGSLRRMETDIAGIASPTREHRLLGRQGQTIFVESTGVPIVKGGRHYVMGVFHDVTDRKRAEDALRENEERFRSFVENANDIVYSLTLDGIYVYVSPNWTEILGHETSEIIGHAFTDFVYPDDHPTVYAFLERMLVSGEKQSGLVYRIRHKNGDWKWLTTNATLMRDAAGKFVSFLGIGRDITEGKQMEEELQYQATTDGLTGIFNRRYFLTRADEELMRIQRFDGSCSLLMLDIDHFKMVNDVFGHAAGDAALQWITLRCREATRSRDFVGRIGGDEFAILLLEIGILGAKRVAERLRQSIQDTSLRTEEGIKISLSVSIGIAEHLSKSESLAELMVRADKALYRAKNEGRNKVVEAE